MHHMFIKHLLCARPHSSHLRQSREQDRKAPTLMELILYSGRRVSNKQINQIVSGCVEDYKETKREKAHSHEQSSQGGPP